ncbi:MAG: redox-sensing transcriptional repressor Rex [Oscillospiraceae bacterium]|nr:redox-sensing transcriptional repressor Rex [Oscillospiraceae bacterium]
MKKQNISDAVIRRLPRYYRYLNDLQKKETIRVSSNLLSSKMGFTASQIRQDFSCFGEFGQQGYGYNVEDLKREISQILGMDRGHHIVLVGVGNLGHALLNNFNFSACGFAMDCAFDVDPSLVGTEINGTRIYHSDKMAEVFAEKGTPDVAVLCVPKNVAQKLTDQLVEMGVMGFWNITNIELNSSVPGVEFEEIHLSDSLLTLSYRISNK